MKKNTWLTIAALACTFGAGAAAQSGDLAEIRQRGSLSVAVYRDFAPFSQDGKGIDIDIANALAGAIGVRAEVRDYDASESMDDDLRLMVWKGGNGAIGPRPSDVMLHVPVDAAFAARNPQVSISAPYYRETLAVARSIEALPPLTNMLVVEGQPVGVEVDSITDMALMSHDGGRYRPTVRHYLDIEKAEADLRGGAIVAFFGTRSQVEPMVAAAGTGFAMSVTPPMAGLPQAGWSHGIAVKADRAELGEALGRAMQTLEADGTLDRIFRAHGVTRVKPL
ncbi:substrate-binding periplasmic protein [Derxia gummosa]|uniref:Substrate-binding periplasmic protein n=1 Tax=Derxia gummosa DSM 723 TaxID=1121388 RepID=A0A8B6XCN7_9BURK|nr:transporter substrate-binding domain-containing protein [Derxia gummosa]